MNEINQISFAPQRFIKNGITNIDFYTKAFGATELRRWANDDGSIHVAELSIGGAIFHLHEHTNNWDDRCPAYQFGLRKGIALLHNYYRNFKNNPAI